MAVRRLAMVLASAMLTLLAGALPARAVTPVEGVASALELTGLDALTQALNGLARREIELTAASIENTNKRKRFVNVLTEQFSGDTLSRLIETTLLNNYDADVYEAVIERFSGAAARHMRSLDRECRRHQPGEAPLQAWHKLRGGGDGRRRLLLQLARDSQAAAITDDAIVTLGRLTASVRASLLPGGPGAADTTGAPTLRTERTAWLVRRDAAWMAWCFSGVGNDEIERFDQLYRAEATTRFLTSYHQALAHALARIGQRAKERLSF